MKKAIAYTSDIILGRTGEVITRAYQKEMITRHAADNDIEIVAWFEDEMYNEDVQARPGVKAMLACEIPHDTILVERVWCFTRNWPKLEALQETLAKMNTPLESATTLWDCVSQMSRRRFDKSLEKADSREMVTQEALVKVRRPEKLNFVVLKKAPIAT